MRHDILRAMRLSGMRPVLVVLVALLLATGPMLGALVTAPSAHSGMAMSDSSGDDGCCDHSAPNYSTVCAAHCAAGVIVASMAFVPSEAVSTSVTTAFVLPSATHAPVPDTAPPKSAAA